MFQPRVRTQLAQGKPPPAQDSQGSTHTSLPQRIPSQHRAWLTRCDGPVGAHASSCRSTRLPGFSLLLLSPHCVQKCLFPICTVCPFKSCLRVRTVCVRAVPVEAMSDPWSWSYRRLRPAQHGCWGEQYTLLSCISIPFDLLCICVLVQVCVHARGGG